MKTISARQANHEFSALLSRAERGEEISDRYDVAVLNFTYSSQNGKAPGAVNCSRAVAKLAIAERQMINQKWL